MAMEPESTLPEQPEPGGVRRGRSRLALGFRVAAVAIIALLIALLVQRTLARGQGPHLISDIRAGKEPPAPPFELEVIWPHAETWPPSLAAAIADRSVSLPELRGHPVVINFWASWCVPCKAEAPRLVAAAERHLGTVAFLGIDVQDFRTDARAFLERYRTNYVSLRDGGPDAYDAYGLTGIPETYYLDANGRVVTHSLGEVSTAELEAGVQDAIGR